MKQMFVLMSMLMLFLTSSLLVQLGLRKNKDVLLKVIPLSWQTQTNETIDAGIQNKPKTNSNLRANNNSEILTSSELENDKKSNKKSNIEVPHKKRKKQRQNQLEKQSLKEVNLWHAQIDEIITDTYDNVTIEFGYFCENEKFFVQVKNKLAIMKKVSKKSNYSIFCVKCFQRNIKDQVFSQKCSGEIPAGLEMLTAEILEDLITRKSEIEQLKLSDSDS